LSGSAVQPLVDRQCSAVNLEHWDRARQGRQTGGSTPDEGFLPKMAMVFLGYTGPPKMVRE